MGNFQFFAIALILIVSCQSYNPNVSVQTAVKPELPDSVEDVEAYLTAIVGEMYPNIGKYRIKIVDKGYQFNFLIGGNEFDVKFNAAGKWKRSKVDIRYQRSLPQPILDVIKDDRLDGWQMVSRRMIETKDSTYYKLEFKKKEVEWDLHFDRNGNLLKKQKEIKKIISS